MEREAARGHVDLDVVALLDEGDGAAGDKATRDAESLVVSPGGSEALVGYEGSNSFWVVPLGRDRWQASRRFAIPEMAAWPSNGGPETLTMLPSRRPLVIAEQGGDSVPAIIIGGREGGNVQFRYAPPQGFSPTDAAVAGDKLYVLNRAFSPSSGVAMALVELDVAALVEGALVSGREIARLRPPVSIDNMEGIALREVAGRSFLYLISDDNFSGLQRTLLLKFELGAQPMP